LNDRAVVHTGAAAGTEVFDNAPGTFADLYFKVPGCATDLFQVCVGNQFNVQMPADLDQYR
jgi:hypothetical protein